MLLKKYRRFVQRRWFMALVLTLFFGIYPAPILDVIGASVENLLKSLPAVTASLAMK